MFFLLKEANHKCHEGSKRAHIIFPRGKNFVSDDAIYSEKSQWNLLSFKDIHTNEYHIETINEGNVEYLFITTIVSRKKNVLEKLSALSSGLYYTNNSNIKVQATIN